MKHRHTLAVASALFAVGLTGLPTMAADPVVPAAPLAPAVAPPAVLYELGPFERRGVAVAGGGTLEVRSDGCWISDFSIVNNNATARTVTLTYRWETAGGRHIAAVAPVSAVVMEPGVVVGIDETFCDAGVAANYPLISSLGVVRVLSVH